MTPWLIQSLFAFGLLAGSAGHTARTSVPVSIGQSVVTLNGPWQFHTGDDAAWSDPAFDDSAWAVMDLSAPASATDGDVGIPNYASGWGAKGFKGYQGFAWYRIHLDVSATAGDTLAVLGPWVVESAYQIFANGQLLGSVGNFSGGTPVAHGYHYPRYFTLPPELAHGGPLVIAIRVWAGSWVAGSTSGGIHVAPAIGRHQAVADRFHMQWLTIFEGYAGDALLGLLFLLMVIPVLCFAPMDRGNRAYPWLAAALVLSAIQRGNQAFFFWTELETLTEFVWVIIVLVGSLNFAAWLMAWRAWFQQDKPTWVPRALAVVTLILMGAQILGEPWMFVTTHPHWPVTVARLLIRGTHLAFIALLALIVYRGIRTQGRDAWIALPAVLANATLLFSSELSALHVPGIWFPFGIGVSLSEYASLALDVLLFVVLVRRMWSRVPQQTAPFSISSVST